VRLRVDSARRKNSVKSVLTAAAALAAAALLLVPPAHARERVLTLHSPKIVVPPYQHVLRNLVLRPNGREAPGEPGWVTGFKEQVLVDSKAPHARPLPNGAMRVHHLVWLAPTRVDQLPADSSCFGRTGVVGHRGEEYPLGGLRRDDPAYRKRYGVLNRDPRGGAPRWVLSAMLMNHTARSKTVRVRAKVHYVTGERRQQLYPAVLGRCSARNRSMTYNVPGGGGKGSSFVDRTTWKVPFSGRIVGADSHQHGGANYHTLRSLTCDRSLFRAPAYYGRPDHVYNRLRPIMHEPGPIGTGVYRTQEGIPVVKGELLERKAVHDNGNLHVQSMGFWYLYLVKDPTVERCRRLPDDVVEVNKPRRYDASPNHALVVPQLHEPGAVPLLFGSSLALGGPLLRVALAPAKAGAPLEVGDLSFRPETVSAKVGETVTWRFRGSQPHTVTVANGPRGFSSVFLGITRGRYSVTPRVPGRYRLTCLIHPTAMGQTLVVRR
jgi:plastocyanin